MPCLDREKRLENCKKWREDNKEKIKLEYQLNKNGIRHRKDIRSKKCRLRYFEQKMKYKCSRCEENHISCLEFHHLDPNEKEYTVASMIKCSFEKIQKEMKKCIVLCSNCHKKLHWDDDKIEKLKNDIAELEKENNKFINKRIKKHSTCKICGRSKKEVKFVERRLFCEDCFKERQKNKMRERRQNL